MAFDKTPDPVKYPGLAEMVAEAREAAHIARETRAEAGDAIRKAAGELLKPEHDLTYKDIGELLDITRQRVAQLAEELGMTRT